MYITGTGNISAQKTFGHLPFLMETVEYTGNRLSCIEPDYKAFIDAKQIRRMSRIIRIGVTAAMECLKEAGVRSPDAIVTGTAYGCLEDTGLFLTKMVEFSEEFLTPTAFIQSTHNTIGAQIGLMLQCNNYNNTFVHRGFSFESALLDGIMLLQEKEAANVLVGAVDEITGMSHTVLSRFGFYKQEPVSNFKLYESRSKGTIAGEGAAFFLLATEPGATVYAKLNGLKTFYKPKGIEEVENNILSFLDQHSIALNEIDLVLTGKNGNVQTDEIFAQLQQRIFNKKRLINYKHLCGEYPTSTAFALWSAVNIIKTGTIPAVFDYNGSKENKINRVLIYNHYQNIYHSLILISAC
jgi:3-oxoacyl-(acyl-carrier-protein) synthase